MDSPRVAVAYSAGRDSTALLHATLRAAQAQGIQVLALHVHHGLSPHADAWLRHGQSQCERWARRGLPVVFVSTRLEERPGRGESVEAWARGARYRALRAMALTHGASVVMLAHHRRDQAETLLLQALRGAGMAGMAGMPKAVLRDGVTWLRPWLGVSRESIETYVRRHRLAHVDDASNDDPRFARNRLRLQVWPALSDAFPQAEATLAEAANWAQEASACLGELALVDLAAIATPAGLNLSAWAKLSTARRSNALRAWLREKTGRGAPATLVTRLMNELPGTGSAQWPMEQGILRRYRGILRCLESAAPAGVHQEREACLSVLQPGSYLLPGWGGRLQVDQVEQGGVPLAWLAHLQLKPREGGERFQAGIGRPPRGLKKQFQAAGVPEPERGGPLLYSGGQLVFVPGLGLDARTLALPGQLQVMLRWLPLSSSSER